MHQTLLRCYLLLVLLVLCTPLQAARYIKQLPVKVTAPDFTLSDLDGRSHTLSDAKGSPVVINFWASWCKPCRDELPSLNRAWRTLKKDGITMFAINTGDTPANIRKFLAKYPIEFPVLLDKENRLLNEWGAKGLPATYLLDTEGKIVVEALGDHTWDSAKLLNYIRSLKTSANQ